MKNDIERNLQVKSLKTTSMREDLSYKTTVAGMWAYIPIFLYL